MKMSGTRPRQQFTADELLQRFTVAVCHVPLGGNVDGQKEAQGPMFLLVEAGSREDQFFLADDQYYLEAQPRQRGHRECTFAASAIDLLFSSVLPEMLAELGLRHVDSEQALDLRSRLPQAIRKALDAFVESRPEAIEARHAIQADLQHLGEMWIEGVSRAG